MTAPSDLNAETLLAAYGSGASTPSGLVDAIAARLETSPPGVWISRQPLESLRAQAAALEARRARGDVMPLYGVPFAVKDNIDVEGVPTTAACAAYARVAAESAPVVRRLLAAGALYVGKTNLDQFATGLVGVRSPYGIPKNPYDERYVCGGSSSGSAAAVARGLVSFALGTDTAGSGRVPAAFTNLVGLKPSRGLFSTTGVVPAVRSLDCVSILARTCADARAVADVVVAHDEADAYSRPAADGFTFRAARPARFTFGVPAPCEREFFGDLEAEAAFVAAIARAEARGGRAVTIPYAPFAEAARLLYDGPFIAERLAGLQAFVREQPEALLPVTRTILEGGDRPRGTEVFAALHRIEALRKAAASIFAGIDAMLLPTAPTIYRIDEVQAEPITLNTRLGTYTNFVNLLDLAALAVPNGFRGDGLPTGVTLIGPWGSDARLLAIGAAFCGEQDVEAPAPSVVPLAVVGAHLAGEPLNHQLTSLGARLVRACRTSSRYRLFALPGTTPPKPGLLRVEADGAAIAVEVWNLPAAAFGAFFAHVGAPLSIGRVELEDGEMVAGFVCEAHATAGARDISAFGGWKAYRAAGA